MSITSCLQTLFPLPTALRELLQAEAFLLCSPKNEPSHKNTPTLIRCLEHQSQAEAQQNQIKFTSLSNAFHLNIQRSQIKRTENKNTWCLIIQMQRPSISVKQKINMYKNQSKHFTQNEIIMVVNSMNILFERHLWENKNPQISVNQLIDHMFFTENSRVKLALPGLMYPITQTQQTPSINQFKKKNHLSKFSLFLLKILTLQKGYDIKNISTIRQTIKNIYFQSFCMKQLQKYVLEKIKPLVKRSVKCEYFHKEANVNCEVKQESNFLRVTMPKTHRPKNPPSPIHSKPSPLQQSLSTLNHSNNLTLKFGSLNQMATNKIAQSFQQDQYSYILESNNTSPSPQKGYLPLGLGFSRISLNQFNSRFSPSIAESQIPQELSNSYEVQTEAIASEKNHQGNTVPQPSLQSSNKSDTANNTPANSIIFQVEEQENLDIIEDSSLGSDMIELSFSRGHEDDKVEIRQIQNKQDGTKYFGDIKNGLKQGKGKIFYHDGGCYEGEWKADSITGFGRLFYPSGKLAYAGYWQQGCFHGPGLVLNQHIAASNQGEHFDYTDLSNIGRIWISYRGNFNMDIRQGFGVVKLANGDTISGVWQGNCLSGEGEYKKHDGLSIKGVWKMNKLIKITEQITRDSNKQKHP